MKFTRIMIVLLGFSLAANLYPMNNPTEQKNTDEQDQIKKHKAGLKAALFALSNKNILILLAHYSKEYKIADLDKYAQDKAFLANLSGLLDVYKEYEIYKTLLRRPSQQAAAQPAHPVAQQRAEQDSPFLFPGDDEEFDGLRHEDSIATDTPSADPSQVISPKEQHFTCDKPTQRFISLMEEQDKRWHCCRPASTPAQMMVTKNPNERLAEELEHEKNMRAFNRAQKLASISALCLQNYDQQLPTVIEDAQNEPETVVVDTQQYQRVYEFKEMSRTTNAHQQLITPPSEITRTSITQRDKEILALEAEKSTREFLDILKKNPLLARSTSAPLLSRIHVAPQELAKNLKLINRAQFRGFGPERSLNIAPHMTEHKESTTAINILRENLARMIGHGTKTAPTPLQ